MAAQNKCSGNDKTADKIKWHLGDYEDRVRKKNVELKALPRIKIPTKPFCNHLKTTKCQFPQPLCKHINPYTGTVNGCSKFYHDIENTKDTNELKWLKSLSDQWHQSTKDEKLLILSQWVSWPKPANKPASCDKSNISSYSSSEGSVSTTNTITNSNNNKSSSSTSNAVGNVEAKEEKQTEQETAKRTNRFPKNYGVWLWGENGHGYYKICINYLCHILQCGISSLYTLIAALWNCRSQGMLIPQTNFKYEGRVSKWREHFENFLIAEYDFVGCHYINRKTSRLYIEKKNGKEVTLNDIYWHWMSKYDPFAHKYNEEVQVCLCPFVH